MLRLLRSTVRKKPIRETVKKEVEIHTSFAVILQTAKVMATCIIGKGIEFVQ